MLSFRPRLSALLDATGALDLLLAARRFVRLPYLPIVAYHRIGVPQTIARDLDETVVDATPDGFKRQLDLLTSRFTLIVSEDLRLHFLDQRPLPNNAALITFDDGYRECHDVALPALQRAGAKAVFFIPTDYITARKAFWWDRANYLVKHSTKARAEIEYPSHAVFDLTRDRTQVVQQMLNVIKETFALDIERYLQTLGAALGVPWRWEDDCRIANDVLMTWDQVRALHRAGMDVQSHTRTHRVLQMLPHEELGEELAGSRRILEEQLDAPVRAIAYPVTLTPRQHGSIFEAVRDAGYDLGFSTARGLAPLGPKTNPLDIQRMWVDPSLSHSYFRATVAIPHFAYRGR